MDLSRLAQYRENNRIEAKRALGGLPHSIWETYSAFANALGGIILLGVDEDREHALHPVHLPDPEALVREFREILRDPKRVSANILTDGDVRIEDAGGCRIVVIRVPRAQRQDRPVYLDGSPYTGTYRRSGEGDYRCTRDEVDAMLRDAAVETPDMALLQDVPLASLEPGAVDRCRARLAALHPEDGWERGGDFLPRLGAAGAGPDGALHPTAAGLLLLGTAEAVAQAFPGAAPVYREAAEAGGAEIAGGCLLDFCFRVGARLPLGVAAGDGAAGDGAAGDGGDAPVHRALREALANCLVNADYRSRAAVEIVKEPGRVTFTNPGVFRIGVEAARSGGLSDPRNAVLSRMFRLLGVGAGLGMGIPGIYAVWKRQGWAPPSIAERFAPARTVVTLPLRPGRKQPAAGPLRRQLILSYLTDHAAAGAEQVAAYLDITPAEARAELEALAGQGLVSVLYRLKA